MVVARTVSVRRRWSRVVKLRILAVISVCFLSASMASENREAVHRQEEVTQEETVYGIVA
jgi:hypothetical protein